MKKTSLFLLCASAATLTVISCSQDKKADATTTTTTTTTTQPGDTAIVYNDADYRTQADATANRMATDMSLTDTAVVRRVRTVYYDRARRMGELHQQYASDTTGMYTSVRTVNTDTDNGIKNALNSPDKYHLYETNRTTYYGPGYTDRTTSTPVVVAAPVRTAPVTTGTHKAVKKFVDHDDSRKTKYVNGSKVKVQDDGDVKIKHADGTKVKIDADGHRTTKRF